MSGVTDNKMKGRRALLRLSVRAVKRAPLRSLLIVVLIALMVAVGSLVATVDRTNRVTAQDLIDGELGSADLMVSVALVPGSPWGIFGSPDLPFSTGVCSTTTGPDGTTATTCQGNNFPSPVPFPVPPPPECVPGVGCGDESVVVPEPTPAEQAAIDRFEAWKSTFDPDATAVALGELLNADVTVIREAREFERQAHSPFVSTRTIEALTDVDVNSPINDASIRLVEGRLPQARNEVAFQAEPWAAGPDQIGQEVVVGGQQMTLVGRVARAAHNRVSSHWGVVTPETLDASTMEVTAVRFRIADIDNSLSNGARSASMRLNTVLPGIERVIGQPIYAATSQFLAAPIGTTTWSIIDRNAGEEFGYIYGNGDQSIAVAIGTTALTGLIGLQVILVIATAFTVGRRRRAREFGQLITVGADARHLRRLAVTEGFVLGGLGAALGIAVGAIVAQIGVSQNWWGDGNIFQAGVRFSPVDWLGPVVIGMLAAVLAAWWPVRKIADAPLAAGALANVPSARPAAYIPKLGALLAIGGVLALAAVTLVSRSIFYTAGPLMALFAILATFLGLLVLIGTILSWVGRRADQLPLLARLVVRNADRHRNRSWLVVGAFILTIGIPIAIGAAIEAYPNSFGSGQPDGDPAVFSLNTAGPWGGGYALAANVDELTPDEVAVFERDSGVSVETITQITEDLADFSSEFAARAPEVVGELDVAPLLTLADTEFQAPNIGRDVSSVGGSVAVATPELFDILAIDRTLLNQLNTTTALSLPSPGSQSAGQLVRWNGAFGPAFGPQASPSNGPEYYNVQLEYAGEIAETTTYNSNVTAIVSPELAEAIESPVTETAMLFRADTPLTTVQESELRDLANEIWWQTFDSDSDVARFASNGVFLSTGRRFGNDPSANAVRLVTAAIAAAIAALIALTTSALTAVESERELESLIATGARPSIRRSFLGTQALYHLAIAAVLAVPTTVIIYAVAVRADNFGPTGLFVPWTSILLSAVVMPLVVAGLIFVLFRNGRPAVSRRAT